MLPLYMPGDSVVHRLPAGTKLLALFAVSGIAIHAAELLVVAGLYRVARLPWRDTFHQLRPTLLFLVPIFLFHVVLTDWVLGLETVLRIVVLLLLAVLVAVGMPILTGWRGGFGAILGPTGVSSCRGSPPRTWWGGWSRRTGRVSASGTCSCST